jgi:hypothetical protein
LDEVFSLKPISSRIRDEPEEGELFTASIIDGIGVCVHHFLISFGRVQINLKRDE